MYTFRLKTLIPLLFISLMWTACGGGSPTQEAPRVYKPVGKEAAQGFAENFHSNVMQGKSTEVNEMIDIDYMLDLVIRDVEVEPDQESDLRRDMRQRFDVGSMFVSNVTNGALFAFTRLREKDGGLWAQYRTLLPDGGVNYIELLVEQEEGMDRPLATDLYFYMTGERFTETMKNTLISLTADNGGTTGGDKHPLVAYARDIEKYNEYIRTGKVADAVSLYESWPPDLQEYKTMMIPYISIVVELDSARYMAAMDRFSKIYPDDPALDLILMDKLFLEGDLEGLFKRMKRLEEALGGPDSYLEFVRAAAYYDAEMREEGDAAIHRSIELEPGYVNAYLLLGVSQVEAGEFGEAVKTFDEMLSHSTTLTKEDLTFVEYPAFMLSPEYQAWQAQ